jgi:hypothetical protein
MDLDPPSTSVGSKIPQGGAGEAAIRDARRKINETVNFFQAGTAGDTTGGDCGRRRGLDVRG